MNPFYPKSKPRFDKGQIFTCLSLLLLIFSLVSCASLTKKGDKPSPDWSRSLMLGEDVIGSIGIFAEGRGEKVHLVWPFKEDQAEFIRYTQLGPNGKVVHTNNLKFTGQSRAPRLAPSKPGSLHLIWANRPPHQTTWILNHVLLGEDGTTLKRPDRFSPDDINVGQYVSASDHAGGVLVSWEADGQDEIYIARLDADGALIGGPTLVTSDGESPAMRVDPSGHIYLAWLRGRQIYYSRTTVNSLTPELEVEVVDLAAGPTLGGVGDVLDGPELGYANGWVSILWSIMSISDTETGTAAAEFVSFPAAEPVRAQATRIWALDIEDQPFIPYDGDLALTQISPSMTFQKVISEYGEREERESELAGTFVDINAASDFIKSPAAMIGQTGDLAVAMVASQRSRQDAFLEVTTIIFREGRYIGYSVSSKTNYLSEDPVLAVDTAGNLHLAWREGAHGVELYYATTSPAAVASMDRLESGDVANALLVGGLESMASIAFMPFIGFGWILPGLMVLAVWKMFKHQETVASPTAWPWLIIALILYQVIKFISLPTITTYVPFSAWIQVSAGFEVFLRVGVPALILLISLIVALFIYRRYSESTLSCYLALTITDAILTLAIYGVNLLGAV